MPLNSVKKQTHTDKMTLIIFFHHILSIIIENGNDYGFDVMKHPHFLYGGNKKIQQTKSIYLLLFFWCMPFSFGLKCV